MAREITPRRPAGGRTLTSVGVAVFAARPAQWEALVRLCTLISAFAARLTRLTRWGTSTAAFQVAFVVTTVVLSLVVATGLAVLVTSLLAVLVRPAWRSDGGTA
jgi:hypothetical protein